jgi:uncharacterized protein
LLPRLEARVRGYRRAGAVVALSGGVDSAVVTALAASALGARRVQAVTAVSPSYPGGELEVAREIATFLGVVHRTIETGEVEREAYARNDGLRCYHCKVELYTVLSKVASTAVDGTVVLAGANADDATDFRPGLLAADQLGVHNPLLEHGVGKESVRAVARRLGLPVSDRPAQACLSSRVAYGVRITPDLLARIDRAERMVRTLGFAEVRVRHFGDRAAIEVAPNEVDRLRSDSRLPALLFRLRALGWSEVVIEADGYRPGSMNATLSDRAEVAFTLDQIRRRPARR